jgi:hypothetical protein
MDNIKLKNFFSRAYLWLWAIDIILLISLVFLLLVPVELRENDISSKYILSSVEDKYYHMSIGAHLFPFTVELRSINPVTPQSTVIRSNVVPAIILMFLGFLMIAINTKDSANGLYAVGPFIIYSAVIIMLMGYMVSKDSEGVYYLEWFPAFTWMSLSAILTGTAAALTAERIINRKKLRRDENIRIELH